MTLIVRFQSFSHVEHVRDSFTFIERSFAANERKIRTLKLTQILFEKIYQIKLRRRGTITYYITDNSTISSRKNY